MTKAYIKRAFAILIAIATLTVATCLVACNDKPNDDYVPPPDDGTGVKAIRITENPRTEYAEGEVFSTAGMVIVADWYGDDEPDVLWTGEYTYTHKGEPLSRDVTEIVFSYEDATVSLPITVTAHDLVGIEIVGVPETFIYGDTNNKSAYKVRTVCGDCDGWEIDPAHFTVSEIKRGSKKVVIDYTLGDRTFSAAESIYVSSVIHAAPFQDEHGAVSVPADNSDYVTATDCSIADFATGIYCALVAGRKSETGDFSLTFHVYSEITASAELIIDISSSKGRGDPIDRVEEQYLAENLIIEVNGEEMSIDPSLFCPGTPTYAGKEDYCNFVKLDLGSCGINQGYNTVTLKNKATTANDGWVCFYINDLEVRFDRVEPNGVELGKTVDSLRITGKGKTNYAAGERLDFSGLSIIAEYTDGTYEALLPEEYEYTNRNEILTPNVDKVIFSYGGAQASLPITVSPRAVTGIDIIKAPDKALSGDIIDPSELVIETICSDGSGWVLDPSDYTIDPITPYTKELKITYTFGDDVFTATRAIDVTTELIASTAVSESSATEPTDKSDYITAKGGSQQKSPDGRLAYMIYSGKNAESGVSDMTFVVWSEYDDVNVDLTVFIANAKQRGDSGSYYLEELKLHEQVIVTVNGNEITLPTNLILPGKSHVENNNDLFNFVSLGLGIVTLNHGYNSIKIANRATSANQGWVVLYLDKLVLKRTDAHFGDWTVDKPATCTENGHRYRICAECGEREDETILAAASHSVTGIQIVTPPTKTTYLVFETFDKTGMTVKALCSNCDGFMLGDDDYTVSAIIGDTVTVSYTYGGETYECTQKLNLPVIVEAENAVTTGSATPPSDNSNYVVSNVGAKNDNFKDGTSGGAYLGGFSGRGKYITFNVYAEQPCDNVKLYLRVATGWNGTYNFSDAYKLTINEQDKSIDPDAEFVLNVESNQWFTYFNVYLGSFSLQSGYNSITITINSANNLNIDCLEVVFDA